MELGSQIYFSQLHALSRWLDGLVVQILMEKVYVLAYTSHHRNFHVHYVYK
jgi:hypothetical protein